MTTNLKHTKNYTELGATYQLVLPLNLEGIARFRTGFLSDACEDLFFQMVRRLDQMGELAKETVFIDGTKLEACANKYTFVWRKSVGKWEEKMFRKIQDAVSLLNQEYLQSFCVSEENKARDLQKICRFLERQTIYDWHTASFQGRNNYCKTDPDSLPENNGGESGVPLSQCDRGFRL